MDGGGGGRGREVGGGRYREDGSGEVRQVMHV
jgi:hypothetical protein